MRYVTDSLEIETKSLTVVNRADGEILLRTADNQTHGDSENRRLFTEDLQHWLFNHTHPTPSGPSLPPLGRPADVTAYSEGQIISNDDLAGLVYTAEVNSSYEKRVVAGMCQTLVTLLSAVSALSGPAPEQALKIALEAQGLIPAGVVSLGDWFTQASDSFKDAADSEELAAELDAQGILCF